MSEPRVIKRYANRKLYDTQRSRYVTLDQIADLIRAGHDVKIVDNTTKDDLTSITLAQIIFEQEKKQKAFLPLSAMKNIIQSGGASLSELASHAGAQVTQMKEKMRLVFARPDEASAEPGAEPSIEDAAEGDRAEAAGAVEPTGQAAGHSLLRDLVERSQLTFEELQKRIDDRIQKVVDALAPWAGLEKEVGELSARLVELEKRLSERERGGSAGAGRGAASQYD